MAPECSGPKLSSKEAQSPGGHFLLKSVQHVQPDNFKFSLILCTGKLYSQDTGCFFFTGPPLKKSKYGKVRLG